MKETQLNPQVADLAPAGPTLTMYDEEHSDMADIAELLVQLDELKRAYRSGARSIAYEGKSISYGSGDEMRAAIASLEAELGLSRPIVGVVRSTKGF
jgi:hypothetical protein